MPGPEWMNWEQTPWFARGEASGPIVQLCDRLLELGQSIAPNNQFLRTALPDLANEFAAQWVAVAGKTPHWQILGEFGRCPVSEPPFALAAEALDRDATVFHKVELGNGTTCGVIVVPLGKALPPSQVLILAGRAIASDSLPAATAAGRVLGRAMTNVTHREKLLQRSERMRATLNIAAQFSQATDSQSLLELIAREATQLIGSDRASIFIWDREAKEIVACPALGVDGGNLRLKDDIGIVGEVIQTGKTIQVDDAYQDPRFNKEVDLKLGYTTRNLLCVPLIDQQQHRIGAFEVINKLSGDFDHEDADSLKELGRQAATALQNTQEREQLARRHRQLTDQVTQGVRIIGESAAIVALRSTIERVAATDLPVLILGESGTGKEVVAQALHYRGARREQPFVAVNCAAMPDSLLESELFGHEKGAFTDAREARPGKFELAHGGTLFLDEIGDMSLSGQAKLLRVLEQKVVTRVGGSQVIPVNVRVVAATNANLQESIRSKKFREDLYYRLGVVKLDLPPLRERPEDILLLADFFLVQFCRQANRKLLSMSPEARQRLQAHNWPGNIRELRNLMERVSFLCAGDKIETADLAFLLSPELERGSGISDTAPLADATAEFQKEHIRKAIKFNKNNMSEAARSLGLHRSNLYRKMRQLEMNEADGEMDE